MIRTLREVLRTPAVTPREILPDLPDHARGLPAVTSAPCLASEGCAACVEACPTGAVTTAPAVGRVSVDLGRCLACGLCTAGCPSGTLVNDRRTTVAVRSRAQLIRTNLPGRGDPPPRRPQLFSRSFHLREVSTGDNATDLEVAATTNPIFDAGRFGIHFVASPRYADGLVVTGPVARAMQAPLRRCFEAMAEPRMVIAVGAAAISGGVWAGGYAAANGVDRVLPVDVYVPGNPPHPWMILHGLLLAMGHPHTTD